MIGFFPDPYPDELLYSVCARFADRVQYRGKSSVIRELFGTRNAVAIVDFPCRLGHLVDILPSGHHYTVDRFIDDHTLLPFYSPFCPPQRINQVREDMRGSNGCRIYGRLGILVNRPADWLQFCPICVNNDIQKFGECYWHRVHQLPGVKVCPIHGVFLEESQAHKTSRKMLRFKFNRLYVWLEQYDAEWFEAHLPPRFCRVGISPIQSVRVDWLSRDLQLAAQVRESANRLLHTTGHPIRITRTTIGKDIGQRTLIQKEIHKLPLTASALVEVVETHLEYAIRRLEWATQCFLQEKIYPKRWQLLQRASLKPNTVALPLVQQAIEAALASLEPLRND